MTSDFLGLVTEIFVFALILVSWIPRSFQRVSVFLEASWSRAPLNFDSDFVLDPSLPDTEATFISAPLRVKPFILY